VDRVRSRKKREVYIERLLAALEGDSGGMGSGTMERRASRRQKGRGRNPPKNIEKLFGTTGGVERGESVETI